MEFVIVILLFHDTRREELVLVDCTLDTVRLRKYAKSWFHSYVGKRVDNCAQETATVRK